MKRFYNNDDSNEENGEGGYFDNNEDDFDDMDDDDISDEEIMNFISVDFGDDSELNVYLLEKATAIAEKNIFWWFKGHKTKIIEITDIYNQLKAAIQSPPIVKEE